MGRKVSTTLLIVLGVALAIAGPAAGDMQAAYSIDAAVQQLMSPPPSLSMLEDSVAPEFTVDMEVHRRVLAGIGTGALNKNKAACNGPCPARGGSYTNRGCNSKYQCRGG
ncbi:uncharacterized protein LOC124679472 [Lolium rigidum]|uniref:uncharacterized protein LOC124669157 n=1 Tax=Lolium rigidum TaxID=89674 RepID=UPI001F5CF521|nr:uncharacterized protein LOC124669157 [Lolium rigidum]XP_047071176.1 uncharacterized protein LOC124679472 [Lolium rigidum]